VADRAQQHHPTSLFGLKSPSRAFALTVLAAAVAMVVAVASGALNQTRHGPATTGARSTRATHQPSHPTTSPTRGSLEARLSLAQLAGQRIIYAYSGLTPPQSLLARIRAGEAAGVIFFGPNIASTAQIRAVIGELQSANASSPVHAPLLMMVDQEGGLIRRLPGAPTLSEKQIGAAPNASALAAQAGTGAGNNLLAVGITVNLAPVVDVYRQAGNFIDQYQRSYSSNAAIVAQLAGTFITAQQQTGVAATAKHFPGLGAATTTQSTDDAPVTLNPSLNELRSIDEVPYQIAIAAGVKLVMTSWATYPALDPHLPAGLSSTVIHGELRGRLGFHGVTITDGLGAGALARFGGFAQRGLLAAHAGADLLLCSTTNVNDNTPANGTAVLDALVAALSSHHLDRTYAEQAAARVITLRSSP
jgi:beta-N-acetylhexosaminidase